MKTIIICLSAVIVIILFGLLNWFIIPFMKLNRLIVWLNKNEKINSCAWISDYHQSLLCIVKPEYYKTNKYIQVKTKNKVSIKSLFKFYISVKLLVQVIDLKNLRDIIEISSEFDVLFVFTSYHWTVNMIEKVE
ncbi:MAG: hypothetical protein IKJ59_06320 [Clostridia bacterium]|nr:hypothetical protein [Clostridia bacterium]